MKIIFKVTFFLHVVANPVAPRIVKTISSVNGQSIPIFMAPVRRTLTSDTTGLRRSRRDAGSWNRMRNTLSKVYRKHPEPSRKQSKSLRNQIEQHYRNYAHQVSSSPLEKNHQTRQVDIELQFLMEFFF